LNDQVSNIAAGAIIDATAFETTAARDRACVYRLVAGGQAQSRGDVARLLGLRSTTVSRAVAALISRRLLVEATSTSAGRGRPAGVLIANPRAIGGAVIHIVSQSLAGALVDLNGEIIHRRIVLIPRDAGNEAMAEALRALAQGLMDAMPHGMASAGIAVSLSGLIDLPRNRWLMASRWPAMRDLDIEALLGPIAGPVRICRNLDAELRARVAADPNRFSGGTLLLHWGWGIGLSYAVDGEPLSPAGGSFGEIGHWRFSLLDGRRCGCGNAGCLETGAALWALMPVLRARWPSLTEDEDALAETLPRCDLLSVLEVQAAASILARAVANACRLLFPQRILVSGPLVANPGLFGRLDALFRQEGAMASFPIPPLMAVRASYDREIQGAASVLLASAARRALADERG
jgi:transcriptional regulator of PTS gene